MREFLVEDMQNFRNSGLSYLLFIHYKNNE
jgi:hypothetical protein